MKESKIKAVCYFIVGMISIIFAIIMWSAFNDIAHVYNQTYGGDAYTGIQHAAVATSQNVETLISVCKTGFGFLLAVIGLLAIVKGIAVIYDNREKCIVASLNANDNRTQNKLY